MVPFNILCSGIWCESKKRYGVLYSEVQHSSESTLWYEDKGSWGRGGMSKNVGRGTLPLP